MFIDADTHVDECEDTWASCPEELAPTTISFTPDQVPVWMRPRGGAASQHTRFWFIDGKLHSRRIRSDELTGTNAETRELRDVGERISDMAALDVDVQVIFPTLFLTELTQRTDVDIALCTSYNNWLADRCKASGGKLQWVAILPLGSIADAVAEIRRVSALGACGIFKRGVEWNRAASDSYFFPVYAEAERLNLSVCFHSSLPWTPTDPTFSRYRTPYTLGFTGMSVLAAFYALVADRVPEQFPSLRFGFIEAGSSWLIHLSDILGVKDRGEFLESQRLFVTCETAEDLGYMTGIFGRSNFMVGTDYSHGDRASVMNVHRKIVDAEDVIGNEAVTRMTSGAAREFYALG